MILLILLHPCLFPDIRGKAFSFFIDYNELAVGLFYMVLFCWSMFPLYLYCWELFFLIMNGWWILSNALSASIEMIIWFLSFILLMWCITLINLWMLNYPCVPGINSTWSWYIILLIYYWIWFANICWDFCIYVHQGYWPVIFFSCIVLVWFGITVMLALLNMFGRAWKGLALLLLLKFGRIHQ